MNYLLYLFLVGNIACYAQFTTPEIEANFNSKEIKDLEKIVVFFQNQISNNSNEDFKSSIKHLSPEIDSLYYDAIFNRIDFKEQLNLYQSISESTFNAIWKLTQIQNYNNDNPPQESVCFAGINKNYSNFLVRVGLKNKYISMYAKDLIMSGDFSASVKFLDYFLPSLTTEELKNPNYQLIIAIHFLTINDQEKRAFK